MSEWIEEWNESWNLKSHPHICSTGQFTWGDGTARSKNSGGVNYISQNNGKVWYALLVSVIS